MHWQKKERKGMITLHNLLDVVLRWSYIEVYTSKDSEDHTVRFFGIEDECPEELMDKEVLVVFANGEPDDECLYIEIRENDVNGSK